MNHLRTARKWNIVFRGLVLALAVLLVACGSDSEDPAPTATTASNQQPAPTVPPAPATAESQVNEDEITLVDPQIPATAESTPAEVVTDPATSESTAAVANTQPTSPPDETVALVSTPSATATEVAIQNASTPPVNQPSSSPATTGSVSTPAPETTEAATTPESIAAPADSTPEIASTPANETESTPESNETFTNPGDGTGGSGMPGERNSNVESDENPVASPSASPVAQFSVEGCEVPDVPNFVGGTTTFTLTSDLNFRTGPGTNCDPVTDEPLGEGRTVTVIGGPVIQAEDGTEWVQIEIDGTTGWISTEFIEPAE